MTLRNRNSMAWLVKDVVLLRFRINGQAECGRGIV